MRRRSDRGKTKQPEPSPKEESPEKSKKSHRHSRKRKKSSSSSSEGVTEIKEVVENIPQPLEVQVKDIELPQGENSQPPNAGDKIVKSSEEPKEEWKEDNKFWESEGAKPTQEPTEDELKEKEESSLWKVQSANGAGGGGEIQKLKICRQRPTESPEIGESSLRKRLSRGNKDGRSTDDSSTHEESERDTKKSKHKTRSSSRNSPLVSPTVVCDLSEDSPTKIKIINVSNINTESKGESVPKPDLDGDVKDETQQPKPCEIQEEKSQICDTLDIALPADEPPTQKLSDNAEDKDLEKPVPDKSVPSNKSPNSASEDPSKIASEISDSIKEDGNQFSAKKSPSPSPSPVNETLKSRSSRSSGDDSDVSNDGSKPRKVKKKRRRELQSTVQRKKSSSTSPKHESSDSEDDGKKKEEAERRESTEAKENKDVMNHKANDAESSLPAKENKVEETNGNEEIKQCQMPRKRRWGSSKSNRFVKKHILTISTDTLKSLIPDAKPIPAEELQLSVEEEEGQLDDDEEDEVVVLVAKEEEKELEQERQRDERQKEKEKEMEYKKRRQERFEKIKPEQVSTEQAKEVPRKIHLLTDDAKKLARSPSPPRRRPTSVLYITHLVRPFTVQQLKNLLLRTGVIAENGFWIDKIKSKCYVEYTTEDAAVETRHALHGVRWPTSNPKTLMVEFAAHDDLVIAQALSEEPEVPRKAEPLNMVEGWVADQARIKDRTRRAVVREWDVGKPEHPDEILEEELKLKEKKEQERRARKERPHRSATPEAEPPNRKARRKEEDAPAKLLDDLFRKTKTSPCIYWLPLTQEQIAVKEEMRRQHMAEHERRMAELKKVEMARRDRERRTRK